MMITVERRCRSRFCTTLSTSLSKVFFAGAAWQAMALLTDAIGLGGEHSKPPFGTTLAFSVLTGVGDCSGVLFGSILLQFCHCHKEGRGLQWPTFFKECAPLLIGSFLSGAAWQGAVDGCYDAAFGFDVTMCIVGFICGLSFFLGITTGRAVFNLPRDVCRDFTLAIACGCASGFFVGTDLRYSGNWLQILVGERTGKDALDVFKAALSSFLGFNFGMGFLILIAPDGTCWTDKFDLVDGHRHGKEGADSSYVSDIDYIDNIDRDRGYSILDM